MALVGSCLLTLGAASIWSDPDGLRRIVWMIIGMINAHSILFECVMDEADRR
jgi:hypothetical protein